MSASSRASLRIRAERLTFSYTQRTVLSDISLTVTDSTTLGIVGESGSGKSTLAKLLVGLLHDGAVTVNERPWSRVRRTDPLRRNVQLIQQDPYASLTPYLSALSAVAEAAQVAQRLSRSEATTEASRLLRSVGIEADLHKRRPRQLSGGQCQRVAIARALATKPSLIVADEPTSALDLSVQAQIINLLNDLTRTGAVGLVLVSHDLAVVGHLTERTLVMQHGHVVEFDSTARVLGDPKHDYTRQLVRSIL